MKLICKYFSAMAMKAPQQVKMGDLSNPTNAAPACVLKEDVPQCSMDQLLAILWWIAVCPWNILQRAAVGLWTVISHAASRTVTGLCSAAIGLWAGLCSVALSYMRRLAMIIVLDIFLGSLDISSDIVNGCLFLNGGEWWK